VVEHPGPGACSASQAGRQQQQPLTHSCTAQFQEEPSKPIALQAFRFEVHDEAGKMVACPAVFEAGGPSLAVFEAGGPSLMAGGGSRARWSSSSSSSSWGWVGGQP
jgi:hypothetical protein